MLKNIIKGLDCGVFFCIFVKKYTMKKLFKTNRKIFDFLSGRYSYYADVIPLVESPQVEQEILDLNSLGFMYCKNISDSQPYFESKQDTVTSDAINYFGTRYGGIVLPYGDVFEIGRNNGMDIGEVSRYRGYVPTDAIAIIKNAKVEVVDSAWRRHLVFDGFEDENFVDNNDYELFKENKQSYIKSIDSKREILDCFFKPTRSYVMCPNGLLEYTNEDVPSFYYVFVMKTLYYNGYLFFWFVVAWDSDGRIINE